MCHVVEEYSRSEPATLSPRAISVETNVDIRVLESKHTMPNERHSSILSMIGRTQTMADGHVIPCTDRESFLKRRQNDSIVLWAQSSCHELKGQEFHFDLQIFAVPGKGSPIVTVIPLYPTGTVAGSSRAY